ncbi:hypothetical protein Theam_1541 [Thermovibrio ammonificans HB-1]|uniref:Uncharacterized protein n=1 Tax=Thermovibrio ammonificans (strain DSM 15698 / JCM 12110 / HB-1) TaxID=648996 RepID=E8T4P3_THEA1|nr:hypothetical protein Theam_1541 [Thermovibrio ammonificans HB-1]
MKGAVKTLTALLTLTATLFPYLPGIGAETGWKRFDRSSTYFKPFVTVENPKDKLVVFITPSGKVYKGRCRKRKAKNRCRVFPGKRFYSPDEAIYYLVVRINPPNPPEVLESGVIGEY